MSRAILFMSIYCFLLITPSSGYTCGTRDQCYGKMIDIAKENDEKVIALALQVKQLKQNNVELGVELNKNKIELVKIKKELTEKINKLNNRKWHNVFAHRKAGGNYTNSRDYPIVLSIVTDAHRALSDGGNRNRCAVKIIVNNSPVIQENNNNNSANKMCSAMAIVPPNNKYRVETGAYGIPKNKSLVTWYELY